MSAVVKAAAGWFAVTFAVAFGLGAVRQTLVAPRFGALAAVAIEVPILLVVSWVVARWAVRRFAVSDRPTSRLAMGGLAFTMLQASELALASAFGTPPSTYLAAVLTAPGALGFAAQVAFAFMPFVVGPAELR
ncbi:MAG: hypothetical protein OEL76_12325 [Siculibacillus sp.]|nr:hypothetical protein [Siculibacillus sp.]